MITATLCAFLVALPLFANDSVNAIIGDLSMSDKVFVSNYTPDEKTRISIHLEFVEKELRKTDVSQLSETARKNRLLRLNELNEYWRTGIFPLPTNPDHNVFTESRRPCFIDDHGRICAVGYLVEQSAGRNVAESINAKHKFEYLLDMNDPVIDHWAQENGFTLKELAMIQPTYGWYEEPVPPIYEWNFPVQGLTVNTGPSKREKELQARLDSLQPVHDSVVRTLNKMTLHAEALEMDLEKTKKDLAIQALRSQKKEVLWRSRIHSKENTIYGMTASLAVLLGFSVFQFFRGRSKMNR